MKISTGAAEQHPNVLGLSTQPSVAPPPPSRRPTRHADGRGRHGATRSGNGWPDMQRRLRPRSPRASRLRWTGEARTTLICGRQAQTTGTDAASSGAVRGVEAHRATASRWRSVRGTEYVPGLLASSTRVHAERAPQPLRGRPFSSLLLLGCLVAEELERSGPRRPAGDASTRRPAGRPPRPR